MLEFGKAGEKLTGIVNDVLDDTLNVTVTLSVIEVAELGGSLVQAGDGRCIIG